MFNIRASWKGLIPRRIVIKISWPFSVMEKSSQVAIRLPSFLSFPLIWLDINRLGRGNLANEFRWKSHNVSFEVRILPVGFTSRLTELLVLLAITRTVKCKKLTISLKLRLKAKASESTKRVSRTHTSSFCPYLVRKSNYFVVSYRTNKLVIGQQPQA